MRELILKYTTNAVDMVRSGESLDVEEHDTYIAIFPKEAEFKEELGTLIISFRSVEQYIIKDSEYLGYKEDSYPSVIIRLLAGAITDYILQTGSLADVGIAV